MKILVVDDEPLARDRLIRFIQDVDWVDGIGVASNGFEALQKLNDELFDVVLLDIRMPGQSGIDVAAQIKNMEQPPAIIFCTAYDEFALEAFKVNAQSYLLKPIQRQELTDALKSSRLLNQAQLGALSAHTQVPSIAIQSGREKERLPLSDVYYFKAEQKYVSLFCARGERIVDESLKTLEENYPELLLRVHRNTLVLKSRVEKLSRTTEGGYLVELTDVETPLVASRRHAKAIRELFE